ncbi:MAG: DUF4760 domain-containing protein [Nitrosospira sp.]
MPDSIARWFRPSRVLGLLLFAELVIFLLLAGWELVWFQKTLLGHFPPDLDTQKWILLITLVSALTGWIITAMVNVRNSIKQHTINTLLQSRLSATYMAHADIVNRNFIAPDGTLNPLLQAELESQSDTVQIKLNSLRYILNYIEFISIGIRYGDLHESLLKSSLRGIVLNAYKFSEVFIMHSQKINIKAYENLVWLRNRWI